MKEGRTHVLMPVGSLLSEDPVAVDKALETLRGIETLAVFTAFLLQELGALLSPHPMGCNEGGILNS